jgi:hypothetical protein
MAGVADGTVLSTTKIQDNGPDEQCLNNVIMGDGCQSSEIAILEARVQDVVDAFNFGDVPTVIFPPEAPTDLYVE